MSFNGLQKLFVKMCSVLPDRRALAGMMGAIRAVSVSLLLLSFSLPVWSASLLLIDQDGSPVDNAVVSYQGSPVPVDLSSPMVMDQIDKSFVPRVLVIHQNQWVAFPNSDDIRHHVYSFSQPKTFELRLFKGSDSDPVQFEKPGIVVLGCNIHDQMKGFIYVAGDEVVLQSNSEGMVKLPDAVKNIRIWHERLSADQAQREDILLPDLPEDGRYRVAISLLPEVEQTPRRTFGSRKFGQ